MGRKIVFLVTAVVFLAACAPVISHELLKKVDPELSFQMLIRDPDRYRGKQILVGGQILGITVGEGETWAEVLQQPLDWRQKPEDTDVSYGRFLTRFEGFLDPAIYAAGKKITVLGEVHGKKVQPLKQMEYTYPVLLPREHHLWKSDTYGGSFFHLGIGVGGVFR